MQKIFTPYASDFGRPNVIIKQFPDTESYVKVRKMAKKMRIYHRLYPNPEKRIFELLLILSKVKGRYVEIFIPYFPYARQDRENKPGEAKSADVLCGLLKNHGVKKLITYDCHFLPRPGNFKRNGLNIENRSAGKLLLEYAREYFGQEKFTVISPDQGSSYFIKNREGHSLKKTRKASKTKEAGIHADVHKIEGEVDVQGRNICILDDIISTGGTIVHATKHLKARGAKRIIVGATHGVFAGEKIAEKILKSSCSRLFVTNAIPNENKRIKTLKILP